MRKKIFSMLLLMTTIAASAQETIAEPEFIDSYNILTSDSTMDALPKENGSIEKHQTKAKSLLGKIGKVADLAGSVGGLGAVVGFNSGNLSGGITGLKTMGTAASVSNVASSASALAGADGMDVVFSGKTSSYAFKNTGKDVRLLIKAENNEYDPKGIYRIVKFNVVGKKRRIQWMEMEPAFLTSEKAKAGGYLNFEGRKYGKQSYLLTIPSSEISEGEYGIFYMNVISSTVIPIGTFAIK